MNGEINWPWLNLGNGFANDIHIIQWYEYTGSFGGTLWILLCNLLAASDGECARRILPPGDDSRGFFLIIFDYIKRGTE